MTYRLSPALFIEDGPAVQLGKTQASRSSARPWTMLDDDARLRLVERGLRPANDRIDAFPLAL